MALRTKGTTAADLVAQGLRGTTPQENLRQRVLEQLPLLEEQGIGIQGLYPNTLLDEEPLRAMTTSILAGHNTLLFGPSGSGKTSLAKDLWRLMPKEVWVIQGDPLQTDPFSLIDARYYERSPPSPWAKVTYGGVGLTNLGDFDPSAVDPAAVPVVSVRLHEGHGFARVQGSSEVFPDNLTGTINLRRLEERGDPTDPLVLEPGKLLQANRGVLVIDEVGKLPIGTQNVLLQALQERTVTPAKSRETFPACFVTVATSNMDDLDAITEPLNDRLANVYVGFSMDPVLNRAIVDGWLGSNPAPVFLPAMLIDAAVEVVLAWRAVAGETFELSEVGSNRTLVDISARATAFTQLRRGGSVSLTDFREACLASLLSHARARGGDAHLRDKEALTSFLDQQLPLSLRRSALAYWCRFFEGPLKGDRKAALAMLERGRQLRPDDDASTLLPQFVSFVSSEEPHAAGLPPGLRAAAVFGMLVTLEAFETDSARAAATSSGASAAPPAAPKARKPKGDR